MSDSSNSNNCYIGLTQWHHAAWHASFISSGGGNPLVDYSRHFSSVEGNTTFYGLPNADTVKLWARLTPEHFRFCFKLPQSITHQAQLKRCAEDTTAFFTRMEPLADKLGVISIQLPATFSGENLVDLDNFLSSLPEAFNYGVEVRHPEFFAKTDREKQLNQILLQHHVNRINFDTRALFAHPADDLASLHAKQQKPQLPVHVLASGNSPLVRFITPMDWQWGCTYLEPWLTKAALWLEQGHSPYFFFHTPDNAEAPQLAAYFAERLKQQFPEKVLFSAFTASQQQESLL